MGGLGLTHSGRDAALPFSVLIPAFIPNPCSSCPLHAHLPLLPCPSSSPPLFYTENPFPGRLWVLPQMEFSLVNRTGPVSSSKAEPWPQQRDVPAAEGSSARTIPVSLHWDGLVSWAGWRLHDISVTVTVTPWLPHLLPVFRPPQFPAEGQPGVSPRGTDFSDLATPGSLSPFAFSCLFLPLPWAAPASARGSAAPAAPGAMERGDRQPLVRKSSSSYRTFPDSTARRLDKEYLR